MKGHIIEELAELINRNGMDKESETPDFALAEMMYGFYESYRQCIDRNIDWHSDWKRLNNNNRIKVGDEVLVNNENGKVVLAIVTNVSGDQLVCLLKNWSNLHVSMYNATPTGRNFEDLSLILDKLNGIEE